MALIKNKRFLHGHPGLQEYCKVPNDHVVVDKKDWITAKAIVAWADDASKRGEYERTSVDLSDSLRMIRNLIYKYNDPNR